MHKFAVDMHIMGRGDCIALVEGLTIPDVTERVHAIAAANDATVMITEIMPWDKFVMQECGFDLIKRI